MSSRTRGRKGLQTVAQPKRVVSIIETGGLNLFLPWSFPNFNFVLCPPFIAKKDIYYYDLLTTTACIGVILRHTKSISKHIKTVIKYNGQTKEYHMKYFCSSCILQEHLALKQAYIKIRHKCTSTLAPVSTSENVRHHL